MGWCDSGMEEFQEFAQRSCSTVRATSHSFMISLPPPHRQFVCIPFLGLELEDIPSGVCDLPTKKYDYIIV